MLVFSTLPLKFIELFIVCLQIFSSTTINIFLSQDYFSIRSPLKRGERLSTSCRMPNKTIPSILIHTVVDSFYCTFDRPHNQYFAQFHQNHILANHFTQATISLKTSRKNYASSLFYYRYQQIDKQAKIVLRHWTEDASLYYWQNKRYLFDYLQ